MIRERFDAAGCKEFCPAEMMKGGGQQEVALGLE